MSESAPMPGQRVRVHWRGPESKDDWEAYYRGTCEDPRWCEIERTGGGGVHRVPMRLVEVRMRRA